MNFLARLDPMVMGNPNDPPNQAAISLSVLIEKACETVISRGCGPVILLTPRRLFTSDEAALYLALSREEIHRLISAKQLPVRHGRRVRLDVHDLDSWISTHKQQLA